MRLLVLSLLLLPYAQACTQSEPCVWEIDIEEYGFDTGGYEFLEYNATSGDWVQLSIFNFDDVAHTIQIPDYDLTVEAEPTLAEGGEITTSEAFQVQAGVSDVIDHTAGDTALLVVYDNVEDDNPLRSDEESPMVSLPLLGLAILVFAATRR